MELKEIIQHLIGSVGEVLDMAGHNVPPITADSKPMGIPGFDSYSGVTSIHEFEDRAKVDLSELEHLFFFDKKNRYLKVEDVAKTIQEYMNRKGRKK
jgi:hypothetical protein